jgi:membrane protein DedA with SNARE-associated domain
MLSRWVDALLGLRGAAAYALVGTLALGEAAAFVGLVLPGELAVLLGGVLASEGRVSLPVMVAVAVSAAVLGDSVGYEVGRHAGARLLARPAFARRFGPHVRRAQAYLAERGGRAVFLGRWTSVLRALVPGVAGMAGMPYGRFLAFNLLGGVAWGATFVLLGYLAGASYRTVEAVAGEASLLLVVLLGLAVAAQRLVRRVAARPERARALADRLLAGAPARWAAGRWGPQLRWLSRRLDPRLRTGWARRSRSGCSPPPAGCWACRCRTCSPVRSSRCSTALCTAGCSPSAHRRRSRSRARRSASSRCRGWRQPRRSSRCWPGEPRGGRRRFDWSAARR